MKSAESALFEKFHLKTRIPAKHIHIFFSVDPYITVTYKIDKRADLEIRNARIVDASHDGQLSRGEEARMVFEVFNNSSDPAYQVQPSVAETTGNKHIRISENVLVECIAPGKGIRYTAVIKADNHLKDGEAVIRIGVFQRNQEITSQTRDFMIKTSKR